MPRFVLEYLEGGAGQEATLDRERKAFAEWRAMPFTLSDEACRDVSAKMLGRDASLPLAIAPTGLNGIFMRNADVALAQGAAEAGVPFIQSTMSNDRMEDVAAVPGLRHWWQLYVFGGEEIWQELVDRADRAGCEALVVTSNAQIFGQREWDERNRTASGFPNLPGLIDAARHPRWLVTTLSRGLPEFSNVIDFVPKDERSFFDSANWIREQMPKSLGWDDLARIRERWCKPLFLKGVLNLEDVSRAIEHGVDGVILGGHGGRQADWAVSALDILPRARELSGDRIALYISGGIRRGSDILKARALGADAVLTGRATLYGLYAFGAAGVSRAIELLRSEMMNELGQYGVPNLDALSPDLFVREDRLPL
ncbi:alpha-hydroxy acid oxidase [Qipengyuania sp. DY56-A-20]|jgi:(S)-mandelate dehydrogenase|nr:MULTISPECIES: alpha-hydroxy acid oxidase [Erythrobacteraceae]MDP4540393.1 alpha-hydroxy acid oxidase [Qipengyuania sp. DY56-A-20]